MSFALTYPSRPAASGDVMGIEEAVSLNFVGTIWMWLRAYLSSLRVSSYEYDAVCPHCGGLLRFPNDTSNNASVNDQQAYRYSDRIRLTPTQYLERLCRLSPHSRINIYKLGIKRQILVWRKESRAHQCLNVMHAIDVQHCNAPLSPD